MLSSTDLCSLRLIYALFLYLLNVTDGPRHTALDHCRLFSRQISAISFALVPKGASSPVSDRRCLKVVQARSPTSWLVLATSIVPIAAAPILVIPRTRQSSNATSLSHPVLSMKTEVGPSQMHRPPRCLCNRRTCRRCKGIVQPET